MEPLTPRRVRALGCRCLGCLMLIALAAIAICALLFALVFRLVNPAHADMLRTDLHHYVILIDQSASVVNAPPTQALARDVSMTMLHRLQEHAWPADTVRVIAFGARMTEIVSTTNALDDTLLERVQILFDEPRPLGATPVARTLSDLLDDGQPMTDVVLITDGLPDTEGRWTPDTRAAYADQILQAAARYGQRGIRLSIILIGSSDRSDWMRVWNDAAISTGGIVAEVASPDQVSRSLEIFPASTLVPAPTSAPPAAPTPTAPFTVTPTPPATIAAVHTPAPTAKPRPETSPTPWLPIAVGVIALLGMIGVAMFWLARRSKRIVPEPFATAPVDEGTLEVCDPNSGYTRRFELREMALGEVWGIGNTPSCRIRLDEESGEEELAALVMMPEGPHIESRGTPMWIDGRRIQTHRLFDGDDIYLGRWALYYENFFRRRGQPDDDL